MAASLRPFANVCRARGLVMLRRGDSWSAPSRRGHGNYLWLCTLCLFLFTHHCPLSSGTVVDRDVNTWRMSPMLLIVLILILLMV